MRNDKGIFTFTRPSINIVGGSYYFMLEIAPKNTFITLDQFSAFEQLFPNHDVTRYLGGENYEVLDKLIADKLRDTYDSILYKTPTVGSRIGEEWVILNNSIIKATKYLGAYDDAIAYATSI
ncbi:hypothetical protein C1N53_11185 [Pontibacter sp. SGAir0037]|nr:hypothetical protein C1N53_11185 [Pontibacter sp. SGAir0037]